MPCSCSRCRLELLKHMADRGLLDTQHLQECLHDANPETRAWAQKEQLQIRQIES